MIRKAGDLFAALEDELREQHLSAKRAEPIGAGQYGVVYESDIPGNVMKQMYNADINNDLVREADLQAVAADMGIAPRVAAIETYPVGIGNRIEMEDIRNNFEHHGERAHQFPTGMDAVRVNQQLGQLALKGIRLEDRHGGNIKYNKMTGRPMQLDFGVAGRLNSDSEKAAWLSHVTAEGFEAAGIGDLGGILRATVMDLLEGGDVKDALDVAKQGFSRLQKIKTTAA